MKQKLLLSLAVLYYCAFLSELTLAKAPKKTKEVPVAVSSDGLAGDGGGSGAQPSPTEAPPATQAPAAPAPVEEPAAPAVAEEAPVPESSDQAAGRGAGGEGAGPPGAENDDDFIDPEVDPFANNTKWSAFVRRVDAISGSLKELTMSLAGVLNAPEPGSLMDFAKGFAKQFAPLNEFFAPLHDQLMDSAAYTQINPAVGLTDLKKLNEWARNPPKRKLDKAKLKWVEVNGYAITTHYIFDRLYPQIEKWGLTEAEDPAKIAYPSWLQTISGYEGGDKATYELKKLQELASLINFEIDAEGDKGHLIRSLEKILRKRLMDWDVDSDYNIFCYGNNKFGIIHDLFDLLTDAALYLSMADMKNAVLNATHVVFQEWIAQTGGGEEPLDPTEPAAPSDLNAKFQAIFDEMKTRIDRKIRIAAILADTGDIIPGPVTFRCDRPPGDKHQPATEVQPDGHSPLEKPPRIPPGGKPPTYPPSQWGKPKPEPLSPKTSKDYPKLDPQGGPDHEPPIGYIDNRAPEFEFAAFSQAYVGYLEAEIVLNPDGTCKSTCPDFRRPTPTCDNKTIDCDEYRNSMCEPGSPGCLEESKCSSEARKCIRTNYQVRVCPSKKPERLYEWIDINGTLVGKAKDGSDDCDQDVKTIRERWEMDFGVILSAPQYCEVCLCVCDTPINPSGNHYFDLQPIVADDGYVITALKFNQTDNVVRISAEQGKLLANGKVDQDSLTFVVPAVSDKEDPAKTVKLGPGANGFRKIGLDSVYGTTREVITGVKFILQGDTLHLSAQTQEVDINGTFVAGGKSSWKDANYPPPDEKKKKVQLDDVVGSLKQLGPSQPRDIPDNKKVIQFDASSLELDGGQAVVPYFDTQATRHHTVRKPLNAVGILYKNKKGFGGFIVPSITPWKKFFV